MEAKAIITTRYRGQQYKPIEVSNILDAYVDGAMDTDSDSWSFNMADPDMDFINTLARDNEVRCSLFVVGHKRIEALHTGFADEISIDHESILSFQGRDITAVATDSACPPAHWEAVRPHKLVSQQARMLKIGSRLHLDRGRLHRKFFTDGSETYWEVWNRFYRKSQRWIWAEPSGGIIAGKLNYAAKPAYSFGSPYGGKTNFIPVERAEWRKNTSQRIGEIFVFGHRGDIGFVARASDPTTRKWIKRPTKIVNNSKLRNQREAMTEAWEEIFESKVGSVEWRLVIEDPGFRILQNRIAHVNIPKIGLRGNFFVVGSRMVIGPDGLYQEVRLRERGYAISRRVPDDPVVKESPSDDVVDDTSQALGDFRWGQFFAEAAKKHHGPWDFKLFLACLLAMCGERESGFKNVRQGGTENEWYKPPSIVTNPSKAKEHQRQFANEAENRDNPYYPAEAGVGPMQLTTRSYKTKADKLGGISDEFVGGRWNPRWNIMVAAEVLRSKLQTTGAERNPTPENIWIGVKAYNGSGPAADNYMREVRQAVENEYLPAVEGALEIAKDSADVDIEPGTILYPLAVKHDGYPNYPMGGIRAHHARAMGNWQSDDAVDLGVKYGTRVFAMVDGTISPQGTPFSGYGASSSRDPKLAGLRCHLVSEDNAYFYTHLSRLSVTPGQKVKTGQVIGYSGRAGPDHLHLACLHGSIEEIVRQAAFYDENRNRVSPTGGRR
jgi:hypothetical protein